MENSTGIYYIENEVDGRRYWGSTTEGFARRWRRHKNDNDLRNAKNVYFQSAWNKYGEKAFTNTVFLVCEPDECFYYEQWALDNRVRWGYDYNIARRVGGHSFLGRHHTEKSKERMRTAAKEWLSVKGNPFTGKKHSHKTKKILSEKRRKLTDAQAFRAKLLYSSGCFTCTDLSKMFGVSSASIEHAALGQYGYPEHPKLSLQNKCYENPNAKLSFSDIPDILDLRYKKGKTYSEIAKIYGVGLSAIGWVCTDNAKQWVREREKWIHQNGYGEFPQKSPNSLTKP